MIDWSKQHCGVHQAPYSGMLALMPDLVSVIESFPEKDKLDFFTWDVKVHMLMPGQFPCIPNWHQDFVPRINGRQRFDLIKPEYNMYMWISGGPLTEFKDGFIEPKKWIKFNQKDEHRGTASGDFCWRGFIRATDYRIQAPKSGDWLRRHCQVYVDSVNYKW